MIEAADRHISEWVSSILPGVDVSFAPPGTSAERAIVNLYLIELRNATQQRARQPHARVLLRYLVSTWAEDVVESHRMLGALLFAALTRPEFEVDLATLPPEIWTALGTAPRPVFVLQTPVRQEGIGRDAPLVRGPLVVDHTETVSLEGVIVGPNDVPIGDAQVELAGLGRTVRTGRDGRFRFALVPEGAYALELRVEARGHSLTVSAPELPAAGEQLVIRFDPSGR